MLNTSPVSSCNKTRYVRECEGPTWNSEVTVSSKKDGGGFKVLTMWKIGGDASSSRLERWRKVAGVMCDKSISKNEKTGVTEDGAIDHVYGLGTVAQRTGDSWR